MTSSGLLTPDDELEEHVREVMDLPKKMETPEDEMEEPEEEDTTGMDEDDTTAEDEMTTKDMKKKSTTSKADSKLMKKLGFSDMEDMQAFSEAMDLFDPRVILNVQNHVSDDE